MFFKNKIIQLRYFALHTVKIFCNSILRNQWTWTFKILDCLTGLRLTLWYIRYMWNPLPPFMKRRGEGGWVFKILEKNEGSDFFLKWKLLILTLRSVIFIWVFGVCVCVCVCVCMCVCVYLYQYYLYKCIVVVKKRYWGK